MHSHIAIILLPQASHIAEGLGKTFQPFGRTAIVMWAVLKGRSEELRPLVQHTTLELGLTSQ